jgi:hypothetical protein
LYISYHKQQEVDNSLLKVYDAHFMFQAKEQYKHIDQVSQERHSRGVLTVQDKIRTEAKANIGAWNEIVRILKIKWGKREKASVTKVRKHQHPGMNELMRPNYDLHHGRPHRSQLSAWNPVPAQQDLSEFLPPLRSMTSI